MMLEIFSYLSVSDLLNAELVDKKWNALTKSNNTLWKPALSKADFLKTFPSKHPTILSAGYLVDRITRAPNTRLKVQLLGERSYINAFFKRFSIADHFFHNPFNYDYYLHKEFHLDFNVVENKPLVDKQQFPPADIVISIPSTLSQLIKDRQLLSQKADNVLHLVVLQNIELAKIVPQDICINTDKLRSFHQFVDNIVELVKKLAERNKPQASFECLEWCNII